MKCSLDGFSLIECVLALAVTAMVLVAVLGLVPAGLDATHVAAQRTAEARILECLRTENALQTTPGDFYFDALGSPSLAGSPDAVFAARVESIAGVTLPGDSDPSMRRLRISISDRAAVDPFADPRRLRVHPLLLAPLSKGGAP